jgi:glycosyltransferase involved in cell wall biosynthesis
VLTDIPSFRTLTGRERVGELWRPGDPASLTRALLRAADRLSDSRRDACRALFDREFSWPAIGRRALSVYRAVSLSRAAQPLAG